MSRFKGEFCDCGAPLGDSHLCSFQVPMRPNSYLDTFEAATSAGALRPTAYDPQTSSVGVSSLRSNDERTTAIKGENLRQKVDEIKQTLASRLQNEMGTRAQTPVLAAHVLPIGGDDARLVLAPQGGIGSDPFVPRSQISPPLIDPQNRGSQIGTSPGIFDLIQPDIFFQINLLNLSVGVDARRDLAATIQKEAKGAVVTLPNVKNTTFFLMPNAIALVLPKGGMLNLGVWRQDGNRDGMQAALSEHPSVLLGMETFGVFISADFFDFVAQQISQWLPTAIDEHTLLSTISVSISPVDTVVTSVSGAYSPPVGPDIRFIGNLSDKISIDNAGDIAAHTTPDIIPNPYDVAQAIGLGVVIGGQTNVIEAVEQWAAIIKQILKQDSGLSMGVGAQLLAFLPRSFPVFSLNQKISLVFDDFVVDGIGFVAVGKWVPMKLKPAIFLDPTSINYQLDADSPDLSLKTIQWGFSITDTSDMGALVKTIWSSGSGKLVSQTLLSAVFEFPLGQLGIANGIWDILVTATDSNKVTNTFDFKIPVHINVWKPPKGKQLEGPKGP